MESINRSDFTWSTFFEKYWRRTPLHVLGGAALLLPEGWAASEFSALESVMREKGGLVHDRGSEVTFLERASDYSTELKAKARALESELGLKELWFDTVRTEQSNGIGSHFDHSDNFALQQSGVKTWRVGKTDSLPREVVSARMTDPEAGGSCDMTDDAEECELRPGDLLYIPIFAPHEGVSAGPSLSVSLVCPTLSLSTALLQSLQAVVQHARLGAQPLPAAHAFLSEEKRRTQETSVASALELLLKHFNSDPVTTTVKALLVNRL